MAFAKVMPRKRRWTAGEIFPRSAGKAVGPAKPDPELQLRLSLSQEIGDVFIQAATGTKFMNFATLSPADMNQYKLQEVERYAAFSLPQLKGATRFATKWRSWALGKARQMWTPSPALLELFLGEQRTRGVSVPRTDYLSMKWLSHHLGWKWALHEVNMPADH